jgi:hypothetical protein
MPYTFHSTEFHWDKKRFGATDAVVEKAVEVLNTLTDEQKQAVLLFGRSRYEDGWDSGSIESGPAEEWY